MLEIAVCCNRVSELEYLYELVEEYRMQSMDMVVRCSPFHSLYDLLARVRQGERYHICLMDHHYQGWMGGMMPEALLREEDPWVSIVSFTNERQEAFPVFFPQPQDKMRLAARLLRPVSGAALGETLGEMVDQRYAEHREKDPRLSFPTTKERTPPPFRWDWGGVAVPYVNIASISYRSHGYLLRLINNDVLQSSSTLTRLEELVEPLAREPSFLLAGRSLLVNMDWVDGLDESLGVVRMWNGDELPVPRVSWEEAAAAIGDYLKRRRRPYSVGGSGWPPAP